jgi:NAD(P) transhydrogenase subunit alpha
MIVGVPKETFPGEQRVALIPASIPSLQKAELEVMVESNAGAHAGYPDSVFCQKGAKIASSRAQIFESADVVVQLRLLGANPDQGQADLALLRQGQILVGMADALSTPESVKELASKGVITFAMELIPRITRAQSMDVLSSMGTVAGYKAVLLAANSLPKMLPMLMTAAGTVTPARVLVMGAGVAGLQAISMARRLGAAVEAYDIRPAVKEQILSLGAKFVELPLETTDAEDKGGYAKAQDESFYQRQRGLLARVIASSDVVISTASVPGKKAPILITAEMVSSMTPGSVIVDLAAERGGNCELTKPNHTIVAHGVTIHGPENLAGTVPYHASQMYAKNISTFLLHLIKKGEVTIDLEDEITKETLLTRDGDVVHPRIREALALPIKG